MSDVDKKLLTLIEATFALQHAANVVKDIPRSFSRDKLLLAASGRAGEVAGELMLLAVRRPSKDDVFSYPQ